MIYKVTVTGQRGNKEVYLMCKKTLESMSAATIVNVEEIKENKKPPNKDDDNWRYHRRGF